MVRAGLAVSAIRGYGLSCHQCPLNTGSLPHPLRPLPASLSVIHAHVRKTVRVARTLIALPIARDTHHDCRRRGEGMSGYSLTELRDAVRLNCMTLGQSAYAAKIGVSDQCMNDFLHARRKPGPKLLKALGVVVELRYHRITKRTHP
jgi:DNA-binding transcriptional regulator YiaG